MTCCTLLIYRRGQCIENVQYTFFIFLYKHTQYENTLFKYFNLPMCLFCWLACTSTLLYSNSYVKSLDFCNVIYLNISIFIISFVLYFRFNFFSCALQLFLFLFLQDYNFIFFSFPIFYVLIWTISIFNLYPLQKN